MGYLADRAWSAGREDCACAFDGDSVPSVEDLRETAMREVTDMLEAEGLAAIGLVVSECVDAYIAAYQLEAGRLVEIWRERYAQPD